MTDTWDTIIVGGGPTGISAAIYAFRFNMQTLLLGKEMGGLITKTHLVENWPGFASVTGMELMDHIIGHAKYFDIPMKQEEVTDVRKEGDFYVVTTPEGEYTTRTIIFSTGTYVRELGIPGEQELKNRGVSYCATCDGAFFKDKTVAVIGGSDSAAKDALVLSEHAKKVYIIYRREEIRPEPINKDRVYRKIDEGKIEIINNTNITEVLGDKVVTGVTLDNPHGGKDTLELDGVFIAIGHIALSDLPKKLGVELNNHGEVIIDGESKTNVEGVYAAGDVANRPYKQAITGAAEGVTAAFTAYEFVQHMKDKEAKISQY